MESSDSPLIILLGGSSGTGKTTLANALVHEFGLAHHLSTGFVREAISAVLPTQESKLLGGFTFDAWKLMPELAGASDEDGRDMVFKALDGLKLSRRSIIMNDAEASYEVSCPGGLGILVTVGTGVMNTQRH